MLDHSTPLQAQGRIDDRMTALGAHRLAAEARAGSARAGSPAAGVRRAARLGWAFAARLRHASARPGPTLAARPQRG
jgi:hypothetical protein